MSLTAHVDPTEPVLLTEDSDGVRRLVLNRPQRMNAFDYDLMIALRDAVHAADADPAVRALVITGAGGQFCTGADLKRDRSKEEAAGVSMVLTLHEVFKVLRCGSKPSVAAVVGNAMGAGLSLALACDLVVADPTARFGCPFTAVGLLPDTGILLTLPERVGIGAARDMLLAGATKDAREALSLRLVDAVSEPGQAVDDATAKARLFVDRAPLAIASTRAMLAGRPAEIDALLAEEYERQLVLRVSDDAKEAAAAFAARRKPVFTGR